MGCIGSKSISFTSKGKYKTKKKERLYPRTSATPSSATGKCTLSTQFGSFTNQPGNKVVNGFTIIVEVPRRDDSEEDHKKKLVEAKTLPNKSHS